MTWGESFRGQGPGFLALFSLFFCVLATRAKEGEEPLGRAMTGTTANYNLLFPSTKMILSRM